MIRSSLPSQRLCRMRDRGRRSEARSTEGPDTAKPAPPGPIPIPKSWPKPNAGPLLPITSTASCWRPTSPKAPAASERCCAAKHCTPLCSPPGVASGQPACARPWLRRGAVPNPSVIRSWKKIKNCTRKTSASPNNCAKPRSSLMFKKKWARCWGGRSQPQSRMGSRDGRRASIGSHRRHSVCLRGSWCCARLLLSSTGVRPGAAHARDPSPGSCPGVAWRGTRSGTRRAQLRAFSRLRSCCNSSHFARRRPISVLHTNHVSCSRTRRRHARTTRSAHPSRIQKTGIAGDRAQAVVELGHNQIAWARQVDLLLPLRHPGCLQPLCRRLDGRPAEGATLASKLIEETSDKQLILPDQLPIHADRGSSMRSKPVAFLLADLSITKTHSRPYTSNDNPYSESQFRTMKYRPEFPDRFGSIQDARA